MPVEVGEFAAGGFIAIFAGVLILAIVWYARSKGRLRGKTVGLVLAALAGLIILYGMGAATFIAG
jgi:hypothetical protein